MKEVRELCETSGVVKESCSCEACEPAVVDFRTPYVFKAIADILHGEYFR